MIMDIIMVLLAIYSVKAGWTSMANIVNRISSEIEKRK